MPRMRLQGPSKKRSPIIAITGGLASGKSTVLSEFERLGWKVLSADEAVHRIYARKNMQLEKLREAARQSERAVQRLEKFIHPLVKREVHKFVRANARKKVIVEIPLLFEVKWEKSFDAVVFVFCPTKIREARALRRGMKPALFRRLDRRQLPALVKARKADYVLQNRKDKKALRAQARLLAKLLGSKL